MIRQLESLLVPSLLDDLRSIPLNRLRGLRVECARVESDISFVRRVCQGRLDIVGHELQRRTGEAGQEGSDVSSILFDLPDLMADRREQDKSPRPVPVGEPGDVALSLSESLDGLASPIELSTVEESPADRLSELVNNLSDFEQGLSSSRRKLHDRIDTIQAEIARRYRDGEVSVDSLLQ